jgi:hypothetical protein
VMSIALRKNAGMVESVDTFDLKSNALGRAGSSPAPGTTSVKSSCESMGAFHLLPRRDLKDGGREAAVT